MGQRTTYPDDSVLTSDALTVDEIGAILQPLTLGMLGLPVSPTSSLVRLDWPTEGAPVQATPGDDICFLACLLQADEPYSKLRDRTAGAGSPQTETWNYTRGWKIKWCLYGPNSLDRARALHSAMFQDYFTDALATEQLFPVSDFDEPVRAPENFNAQWWERVDFEAEFYEFVTETIQRQTVTSVEVVVKDADGVIADLKIS